MAMYNARTREEIQEIVESMGYELLHQHMRKHFRRVVIQDSEGYKYDVRMSHLIKGHYPHFVSPSNPFVLENISLWLKLENKQFFLCKGNKYKNAKKKLFFQCFNESCGEIFDMSWDEIYSQGCGCPFCAGMRVGKYNNLAYLRPDILKEWDYKCNKNKPEDYTLGNGEKVFWICSKCGHRWDSEIFRRTSGGGCPKCNQKKGAKKICDFLVKNNINFKIEVPLQDCRYKGQLYLDFYLTDLKAGIEYNGHHHYKPVRFSYSISEEQAKENLRLQKKKDKIKEIYCEDNNIPLLIIPYWDFDSMDILLEDFYRLCKN